MHVLGATGGVLVFGIASPRLSRRTINDKFLCGQIVRDVVKAGRAVLAVSESRASRVQYRGLRIGFGLRLYYNCNKELSRTLV